jgi:hypothetical protein
MICVVASLFEAILNELCVRQSVRGIPTNFVVTSLFEASQSLFWAGFGMVGLDDFELTGVGGYTRFWSMTMFGAYSIINIIVLLNLLIAMMSNSYSFIVVSK